jgi:predicted ATPase
MIKEVSFRRFKQFNKITVSLEPGITLLAGGNNAGKSSLLHGLAVWEFCRMATIMERGQEGLCAAAITRQGFGLGDDEFSPINVPSLKHLWTNLKTQKTDDDPDGYTLRICCRWGDGAGERVLGFGLALANDRLFIKTAQSNLGVGDLAPAVAYLPPFAGISAHEQHISGAIRRRRIGEGLAGAVLRNLLLDMQTENAAKRARLTEVKADGTPRSRRRISEADLRKLRMDDPWELLQQTLREVFGAELIVDDFREEYHSYINVKVVKGKVDGHKLTMHPGYSARDLMVEGSGFLQWLSVYTLATTPGVDMVLFDEPDAHLHSSLQRDLLKHLEQLAASSGKQVFLATHSSEILRAADPATILEIRSGGKAKYLTSQHQKVGLLEGLGSDYAPRIDQVRLTKRLFFHEGSTDLTILKKLSHALGRPWPGQWVEWQTPAGHKERRALWESLEKELGSIVAFSLRDRDDDALGTVDNQLRDGSVSRDPESRGFYARKWRRRYIEAYLMWPPALAECCGKSEADVRTIMQDQFGIAIGSTFTDSQAPMALLDVRAKDVLSALRVNVAEVAAMIPADQVCKDIQIILQQLNDLARA